MSSLQASSVTVNFSIGNKRKRGWFSNKNNADSTEFTALDDINLKLSNGDKLGIIGDNGAGKTTLLRVLSGILPPSSGAVLSEGRLQSVITMSTGLINSASCTKNIRLRGLSYRLVGDELDRYIEKVKFDSKLGKFLSLPVKSLSSGMKSRLIMNMFLSHQPEILIMDEWIGVADRLQFDSKDSTSNNVINDSKILVLATHRHKLIEKYCNRCLVLDAGRQAFLGSVSDALKYYDEKKNRKNA